MKRGQYFCMCFPLQEQLFTQKLKYQLTTPLSILTNPDDVRHLKIPIMIQMVVCREACVVTLI